MNNNRSKAHLLTAIHDLVDHQEHCHYFPSYEIVMDDLRDYRYYTDDMIHPSKMAIDYIWQLFESTYMTTSTIELNRRIEKLQKSLAHRPFNPNTQAHNDFKINLIKQLQQIAEEHNINYDQDISQLTQA